VRDMLSTMIHRCLATIVGHPQWVESGVWRGSIRAGRGTVGGGPL
jgi:hypothetical protein